VLRKGYILVISVVIASFLTVPAFADVTIQIPKGTGVPGCEETDECFNPWLVTIEVGETVTWVNSDTRAHTVVSGNPTYGPDGEFDSSLFMSGAEFSHTFDTSGLFAYYDVVLPWMQGIVRVIEGDSNEEKKIIINQESKEGTTDQESDVCSSSTTVSLMGPIHGINVKYLAKTNILYREYASNQGFEEYLTGINYEKSEKVSNYVNSIMESREFAIFYFEKNLSSEDEKLMIRVSEKYLEYLYDGKNRFISDTNALYTDKKNEINAIPMQDSRLTICGDDKIEGLEELETTRAVTQYILKQNIPSFIEDWEKNLQIKQKNFPINNFDEIEKTQTKQELQTMSSTISGDNSLKKGDWVKYKIDFEGEGGLANLFNLAKSVFEVPESGCLFSDIEWFKYEVIEMQNNSPIIQISVFCNEKESENDIFGESLTYSMFYIPTDVVIGEIITSEDYQYEVLGFEEKKYGNKITEVIKVYSQDTDFYDNDGMLITTNEIFFEKSSGMMLERNMNIEATNVPLFGDMVMSIEYNAIDYNLPRSSSSSGGGCLIATATFGTELSPQVQQLRELRDNSLLQTNSGSAFMTGFNELYYSFSPIIADLERQSPIFKEAVKLAITPLITSLSILNYVDMDSEAEVLGYGISLILLNVGMYVTVPVGIVVLVRRKF